VKSTIFEELMPFLLKAFQKNKEGTLPNSFMRPALLRHQSKMKKPQKKETIGQ
jgi:hypothetical protein